jgi:uncharacterized protein (DUF2235 family)
VCLLFGGETSWTVTGITDLKHFSERARKHEASQRHIENDVKVNFFGSVNIFTQLNESYRVSIQRQNELVDKNRHINCIKFCGRRELPLQGHGERKSSYNRGIFLDLMSQLCQKHVEDNSKRITGLYICGIQGNGQTRNSKFL